MGSIPPHKRRRNGAVVSPSWKHAVAAVERILGYRFSDPRLLEEALTHSSFYDEFSPKSFTYQRLEFLGDAALGLAVSNYFFLAYPGAEPHQLSMLKSTNVSTEKLARVAVRHGLYGYLRRNAPGMDIKVMEFVKLVQNEDELNAYGGPIKAPKVLADIVESIAAAIYVDVKFDLENFWKIFRGLLEPMVMLEDLLKQPQPVTTLFEICQKYGKKVDIMHCRDESKSVVSIHIDGNLVASGSSDHKETAKLLAAKVALHKLLESLPLINGLDKVLSGIGDSFEIEGAKVKLIEICTEKKWPQPTYNLEKEEGPAHERSYTCAVKIATVNGILFMMGDAKARVKDSENSAASLMIRALQQSDYL